MAHRAKKRRLRGRRRDAMSVLLRQARIAPIVSLVEHNADINSRTDTGETPLQIACKLDDLGALRLLINARADPNCSANPRPPIHHTYENGGTRYLVVMTCIPGDDRPPIHLASEYSGSRALGVLINAGADVNARTLCGETPIQAIARRSSFMDDFIDGYYSVDSARVALLIEASATVDDCRVRCGSQVLRRPLVAHLHTNLIAHFPGPAMRLEGDVGLSSAIVVGLLRWL